MFLKPTHKKAFTMAEAILVMTILGIIAAVMLSTLKPTQWKDKSYQILAKKVLYEIDTATTTLLTTNSKYGTMSSIINDSGTIMTLNAANLWTLYKKYLSTVRGTATSFCQTGDTRALGATAYKLKDGACMGISTVTTSKTVLFPGEGTTATAMGSTGDIKGYIIFDTNDADEPNVEGKDRFVVPINDLGIKYE